MAFIHSKNSDKRMGGEMRSNFIGVEMRCHMTEKETREKLIDFIVDRLVEKMGLYPIEKDGVKLTKEESEKIYREKLEGYSLEDLHGFLNETGRGLMEEKNVS